MGKGWEIGGKKGTGRNGSGKKGKGRRVPHLFDHTLTSDRPLSKTWLHHRPFYHKLHSQSECACEFLRYITV